MRRFEPNEDPFKAENRIVHVNYMKADDFRKMNPRKWTELMQELMRKGGHPFFMRSNLKNQENIVWVHPRYATSSQTDVEELTRVEFLGREKMLFTHEFHIKYIPGFEGIGREHCEEL